MIVYRKLNAKYQLEKDWVRSTGITGIEVNHTWFKMTPNGCLLVRAGYAWDGPSGPAIDTKAIMQASLPHDVGYQMIRLELIDPAYREAFDLLFQKIYREDAAALRPTNLIARLVWDAGSGLRAWYAFQAVRKAAANAADPKNARLVLTAP